jgi:hypothetical protein
MIRTYLTEEEKNILVPLLDEWNGKLNKKAKDAFISAEAIPKIQQINLPKFGPENISTDKAAKALWDKRIQVRSLFISDCLIL